jgi:hypothetical protein
VILGFIWYLVFGIWYFAGVFHSSLFNRFGQFQKAVSQR